MEVYGPDQEKPNVDGISIYTKNYVTTDDDQIRQFCLGQDELKVRRNGHEADVTAHPLDTDGKNMGVTGLLETGELVSVRPIKSWEG